MVHKKKGRGHGPALLMLRTLAAGASRYLESELRAFQRKRIARKFTGELPSW